jgi:hypothetical protein
MQIEMKKHSDSMPESVNGANAELDGLKRMQKAAAFQNNHSSIHREPSHRIFVNRSLNLNSIQFFGFDMDHTLAG